MNQEIEIPEGHEAKIVGNKVFIEPKESEDDKIRKEVIDFLREGKGYQCPNSRRRQQWASWVEKQIEQKPAEWSEEDEETLACAISVFEDFAECKNVSVPPVSAKRYLKRLKSLRPQPKVEWSEEDKENIGVIATHLDNLGNTAMVEILLNLLSQSEQ